MVDKQTGWQPIDKVVLRRADGSQEILPIESVGVSERGIVVRVVLATYTQPGDGETITNLMRRVRASDAALEKLRKDLFKLEEHWRTYAHEAVDCCDDLFRLLTGQ